MGLDVAESSCCWLFIMAYLPTRGHLTRWPILALTIMTEGMAVSKKRCWLHASSGLRDSLPSLRDMMLSAFRYTSMHMKPLSLEEKKKPLCYITYISDGLGWVPEVGFWDYTTQNQSAQLAMNPIFWLNSGYIPQNSTLGTKSITSPYTYTLYIVVSLIQESDPKKNYTQLTSNCMIFSCQGKKIDRKLEEFL